MRTPFRRLTKSDVQGAVDYNKQRIDGTIKRALQFATDPEKEARKAKQYCVCCFYRGGVMAGAAMTENQCGLCEKEMRWSSTHQERLCHDCAKMMGLCKECGSTIDNKEPRRLVL